MKKGRTVQITYLIGLLFWITATIYFFAANWGGLQRLEKISLAAMLMLLFFIISYGFTKWKPHQQTVGAWIFWGGSVAFGVAVALLGQIYNSHADSYSLFLIWLLPSILFAVFTKFPIFIIQSYILLNISVYTYFMPIGQWLGYNRVEETLILFGLIVLNLLFLYGFAERSPRIISYGAAGLISILMIQITSTWTTSFFYDQMDKPSPLHGMIVYSVIIAITALLLVDFLFKRKNKRVGAVLAIGVALNVIIQIMSIITFFDSIFSYFVGILLAIGIMILATLWLKNRELADGKKDMMQAVIKIISILIAVILFSSSFSGFLFIFVGNGETIKWLSILMIVFVLIGTFIKKSNSVIRYTAILSGLFISSTMLWDHSLIIIFIYAAIVAYALWSEREKPVYPFLLLALLSSIALMIYKFNRDFSTEGILITLLVISMVLYFIMRPPLSKAWNLIAAMSIWLALTFFSSNQIVLYYAYNAGYLLFLLYFAYKVAKRRHHWLDYAVYLYLIGFLGYKYYDIFWKLLHKSITFALLGTIVILIALYLDRKGHQTAEQKFIFIQNGKKRWIPIVCLQLVLLGGIIVQKEWLLKNGEDIYLKVEPVDPRSMLQGDYIVLSYNISQTEPSVYSNKVYALLKENQDGYYELRKIYENKEEAMEKRGTDEVMIVGKHNGDQIIYGIEHFFIEEGKGLEWENKAKFAKVRVSKNGDALLIKLTKELPGL